MNFINIKITEKLAGELINCLDEEVTELTAENNRLVESIAIKNKELEETETAFKKQVNNRLELEQKHADFITELEKKFEERLENEADRLLRDIRELNELVRLLELKNAELKKQGAKVVSDDKLEAERDKLVKLVTQLQEENAELKMIMKMAGDKPGRGRPKKA